MLILVAAGANSEGAGVYMNNLRTGDQGWLQTTGETHLQIIRCLGDLEQPGRDLQEDLQEGMPAVLPSVPFRAVCCHCGNSEPSCYGPDEPDHVSQCLQAKLWHCLRGRWRCPGCHCKEQACTFEQLGILCHRHGVLQHPPVLEQHHEHIENSLDVHVARLIASGFTINWHHEECGRNFPTSTPTTWWFGSDSSRIFSKLDFHRPCPDWSNREWCEIASHMPTSTRSLSQEGASATTYASWVECMIGLIAALGTGGRFFASWQCSRSCMFRREWMQRQYVTEVSHPHLAGLTAHWHSDARAARRHGPARDAFRGRPRGPRGL